MPISSITDARDLIIGVLDSAWSVSASNIPLAFEDVKEDDIPPKNGTAWARIQVRHNSFFKATVGGEVGNRRFRRVGLVTIQIFTPVGEGLSQADSLAKIALDAFEGKSTGADSIEFRNARINEIGRDGSWFQTNVLVDFEYDEVK